MADILQISVTAEIVLYHYLKLSGSHLNIKMSSYKYRDPRVKDKTVNMGIPIPGKDCLYNETGPWC